MERDFKRISRERLGHGKREIFRTSSSVGFIENKENYRLFITSRFIYKWPNFYS